MYASIRQTTIISLLQALFTHRYSNRSPVTRVPANGTRTYPSNLISDAAPEDVAGRTLVLVVESNQVLFVSMLLDEALGAVVMTVFV